MHVAEPKTKEMIIDLVQTALAFLGLAFGSRHSARDQPHLLQDIEVTGDGLRRTDACSLCDLIQPSVPLGDGTQKGEIVARLTKLFHQKQARTARTAQQRGGLSADGGVPPEVLTLRG